MLDALLAYSNLTAVLVEAIKEQTQRINVQKEELEGLRKKLDSVIKNQH